MEYCKEHGTAPESKQKNVKIFYELDMFSMRQVGFYRANPGEPVSWHAPKSNTHLTFISILYGLYGSLLKTETRGFHSIPYLEK